MGPQNADLLSAAKDASKAVREFLMRHGGMDNGYVTWAKGDNREVLWHTPRSDDMTANEMKSFCHAELLPALATAIEAHGTGISFVIEATHVEYGCYKTKVTAVLACSVQAI